MAHVFISYSHQDTDFANGVRQQLQNAGFTTWMDHDLPVGKAWADEIDSAIQDAFAVVLILSPDASASAYVNYEWAYARGAGKPLIPILYRDTTLHPRLEDWQHLNFTSENPYALPWNQLFNALREAESNSSAIVPRDAPEGVRRAADALKTPDRAVYMPAIEALAQADHPSAIEVLAAAVEHSEFREVRVQAGLRLSERTDCQDARAVPGLLDALRDRDSNVRQAAADALGQIGDAAAVPGLVEALRDSDVGWGWGAANALISIGNGAVPGLVEALGDDDGGVRRVAADALRKIGTPEALAALKKRWQLFG